MTLKDDLDLDILPLKMSGLMKYTFIPNIKSLSVLAQKLWPMSQAPEGEVFSVEVSRRSVYGAEKLIFVITLHLPIERLITKINFSAP